MSELYEDERIAATSGIAEFSRDEVEAALARRWLETLVDVTPGEDSYKQARDEDVEERLREEGEDPDDYDWSADGAPLMFDVAARWLASPSAIRARALTEDKFRQKLEHQLVSIDGAVFADVMQGTQWPQRDAYNNFASGVLGTLDVVMVSVEGETGDIMLVSEDEFRALRNA